MQGYCFPRIKDFLYKSSLTNDSYYYHMWLYIVKFKWTHSTSPFMRMIKLRQILVFKTRNGILDIVLIQTTSKYRCSPVFNVYKSEKDSNTSTIIMYVSNGNMTALRLSEISPTLTSAFILWRVRETSNFNSVTMNSGSKPGYCLWPKICTLYHVCI